MGAMVQTVLHRVTLGNHPSDYPFDRDTRFDEYNAWLAGNNADMLRCEKLVP